eukprot:UN23669
MQQFQRKAVAKHCQLLGVHSDAVFQRALELHQLLMRKSVTTILEFEKTALIELAAKELKFEINPNKLQKNGTHSKKYLEAFCKVSALTGSTPWPSVEQLSKKFGGNRVLSRIRSLKNTYVNKKEIGMTKFEREHINWHDCGIAASAVFLGCQYAKMKLDKEELARASYVTLEKLNEVIEDMLLTCGRIVGKKTHERGQKTQEQQDEENDTSFFMDGDLAPTEKRAQEFKKWVDRTRTENKIIHGGAPDDDDSSSSEDDVPIGKHVELAKKEEEKQKKKGMKRKIHPMFANAAKKKFKKMEQFKKEFKKAEP